MNVLIYGAGSIGNHLTHACRGYGWQVSVVDTDPAALQRMRHEIYPARYSAWDDTIRLGDPKDRAFLEASEPDLVIIGTPPPSHMAIAREVLSGVIHPKAILIEKPLATPDMEGCAEVWKAAAEAGCRLLIDYNHGLTPNAVKAAELIEDGGLGKCQSIHVRWQEHWGGIFGAHPWLSGPQDTYLGYWRRGGGAAGEHSHGIHLWLQFAQLAGGGRIKRVQARMDIVNDGKAEYDRIAQFHLETENGLHGSVVQDVVTKPPIKELRYQGENGFLEWHANYASNEDALIFESGKAVREVVRYPKTRPDDFKPAIERVGQLVADPGLACPELSIESGLETMLVIAAGFRSHQESRVVEIDFSKGWDVSALV